jgi:hypothetical protein
MDSMWGEQLHLGGLPWKHPKVHIPLKNPFLFSRFDMARSAPTL